MNRTKMRMRTSQTKRSSCRKVHHPPRTPSIPTPTQTQTRTISPSQLDHLHLEPHRPSLADHRVGVVELHLYRSPSISLYIWADQVYLWVCPHLSLILNSSNNPFNPSPAKAHLGPPTPRTRASGRHGNKPEWFRIHYQTSLHRHIKATTPVYPTNHPHPSPAHPLMELSSQPQLASLPAHLPLPLQRLQWRYQPPPFSVISEKKRQSLSPGI